MNYGYKCKTSSTLFDEFYILLTTEIGTDNNRTAHNAWPSLMKISAILAANALAALATATTIDDVKNAAYEASSKYSAMEQKELEYYGLSAEARSKTGQLAANEAHGKDVFLAALDSVEDNTNNVNQRFQVAAGAVDIFFTGSPSAQDATAAAGAFDEYANSCNHVTPAIDDFMKLNVYEWTKFRPGGTGWYDNYMIGLRNTQKVAGQASGQTREAARLARKAAEVCRAYHEETGGR